MALIGYGPRLSHLRRRIVGALFSVTRLQERGFGLLTYFAGVEIEMSFGGSRRMRMTKRGLFLK